MRERYTYICRLSWISVLIQKRFFYQKISALQICQMVATPRLSNKIKIWYTVLNQSQGQTPQQRAKQGLVATLKLTLLSPLSFELLWYLCSVLAFCIKRNFTPIGTILGMKRSLPIILPRSVGEISDTSKLCFLFKSSIRGTGIRQKQGFDNKFHRLPAFFLYAKTHIISEESQCHNRKTLEHNGILKNRKWNFFLLKVSPYSLC